MAEPSNRQDFPLEFHERTLSARNCPKTNRLQHTGAMLQSQPSPNACWDTKPLREFHPNHAPISINSLIPLMSAVPVRRMNEFNDHEAESKNRGPVIKRPCTSEARARPHTKTVAPCGQGGCCGSKPQRRAAVEERAGRWPSNAGKRRGGNANRPVLLWNRCRPVRPLQFYWETWEMTRLVVEDVADLRVSFFLFFFWFKSGPR